MIGKRRRLWQRLTLSKVSHGASRIMIYETCYGVPDDQPGPSRARPGAASALGRAGHHVRSDGKENQWTDPTRSKRCISVAGRSCT